MINLIKNELIKTIKKTSTYIGILIIFLFVLSTNIIYKYNFVEDSNIFYNFFTEYEFLLIIILLLVCGGIISEEFNKGTIKELLINPYSRIKILISKYIALIIIFISIFLIILILQIMFDGILFNFSNLKYTVSINFIQNINVFKYLILMFLAKTPIFIIIIEIVIIIGILTSNTALTTIISFITYLSGTIIENAYTSLNIKFLKVFPQLYWDLSKYIYDSISNIIFLKSIFVCMSYFIILFIISLLLFTKKEIKNV